MNLTQFAIEKNRVTITVLLVVVALGFSLYQTLPRDSMPPFTIRMANIVTIFPGASPERVEQLVSDKIEKVAQELPELKEVSSTSRTGLSVVTVELKDEVKEEDLQDVFDRLRRKLNDMRNLPAGVFPNLDDESIGQVYGIVIGMTGDGFSYAEMKDYADDMKDEFIKLDDAAKVELGGVQEERVFIEFDNARLAEYGLSAVMLQGLIGSTNILNSGGRINLGEERIIIEPTGNFDSVEDIRKMLIPLGNTGRSISLEDITDIRKGYIDPVTQRVRVNGSNAIAIHINLKDGANVIKLGEEVDRVTEKWKAKLPVGLELSRLSSMDGYIDSEISEFVSNLLQSITIVLIVMLIFLGLRTGAIIASLIPLVTITTLMLMGVIGMGLNQVTLAALIMALGMMVDNAIVVAETIIVKMEKGTPAKTAAIEACDELFTPLLISTLTTSAAFLAFYLAESVMGDIVGPIFVVISMALLSSWLISLTIITMFCYLFLKIKPKGEAEKLGIVDRIINYLKVQYKSLILLALGSKWLVMVMIFVAFVAALAGFSQVGFLFFPDSDRNMITVDINLPLGTRIEQTAEVVARLETYMNDSLLATERRPDGGVRSWSSYIGEGPESYDLGYTKDEANSSYAHILVNTTGSEMNRKVIDKLDEHTMAYFPSADIKTAALAAGEGGFPIEIKVSGDDPDELARISTSIKKELYQIAGTKNVKDDWGPKSKKFIVKIDQNRAQLAGITSQDVAVSLATVLDGFQTGEYREGDNSIPIILRGDAGQQSLASLEATNVYSQSTGRRVPLLQVADVNPDWQYSKIKRLDLFRTVNITSELTAQGNASQITATIVPFLVEQSKTWPEGYTYQLGGDDQKAAENMGAVIDYLPLSGFIIVMLLIIQFNSFRQMLMVTLTIPLGIIGVVIGLLIFGEPFGFMPFLGTISLAGIVINNAIVLIDRINIEQTEIKRNVPDAVIAACLQRFRPIVLATLTTVLGMIPLYLSGGDLWEGMSVSIMIGLLFGTVITLLFIPSLYSILYKVSYKDYVFDEKLLDA